MEFDIEMPMTPHTITSFFRRIKAEGITQDFLDSLAELDKDTAVRLINIEIDRIRGS